MNRPLPLLTAAGLLLASGSRDFDGLLSRSRNTVRKSPRKNARKVISVLRGSEKGARRKWLCAERYARALALGR